jgi:transposase
LALGLHLQGASRKEIASLVNRPEESVKTSIRVLLRDGLPALRDRRCSDMQPVVSVPVGSLTVSTRREGEWQVVDFGVPGKELRIPAEHEIRMRTVLLSFLDSGLLSVEETATALGISKVHCRELKSKLACADVEESLIDKRRGQTQDYRMGPDEKAELIQQFAARAVLRLPTSSQTLAELVNERTETSVSARTVRWHMEKLGLTAIRKTLPDLVDIQKKLLGKAP